MCCDRQEITCAAPVSKVLHGPRWIFGHFRESTACEFLGPRGRSFLSGGGAALLCLRVPKLFLVEHVGVGARAC